MIFKADSCYTDTELLALLQDGNRQAFDIIYNRYWGQLFAYVFKVVADEEDAKDIIQELFVSLWCRREKLYEVDSLQAYLFTAARYKGLTHIKNGSNKAKYINSLKSFLEPSSDCLNQLVDAGELRLMIDAEVDKLPPKMREVFILSRKENLSHKSISEKLMISDKTVKKQINNVLKHLRQILAEK